MSDNDPNNDTSNNKEGRPAENKQPLGKLSDFRGNNDSSDGTRPDTSEQRKPAGPESPDPKSPDDDSAFAEQQRNEGLQQDDNAEQHSTPLPSHHEHHRAGTGMYWAAALITLALLTLFFNNRLENKKLSEGITEKLLQQADGHYYARGQINNQPVLFIVDTGASVISIPATLADSIGLPRLEPEQVNTANGVVTVFNTRPVTIRLGDIQLYDVEAHINPGMEPPGVLLGMSFLRRLDFRQRDTRLILKTRPEL